MKCHATVSVVRDRVILECRGCDSRRVLERPPKIAKLLEMCEDHDRRSR